MKDDPHSDDEVESEEAPNTYRERPVSQIVQNQVGSSLIDNPGADGYNLNYPSTSVIDNYNDAEEAV